MYNKKKKPSQPTQKTGYEIKKRGGIKKK